MTSERLFNSFIPPKKNFYTPPAQKKQQISGYAPDSNVLTVSVATSIYSQLT